MQELSNCENSLWCDFRELGTVNWDVGFHWKNNAQKLVNTHSESQYSHSWQVTV